MVPCGLYTSARSHQPALTLAKKHINYLRGSSATLCRRGRGSIPCHAWSANQSMPTFTFTCAVCW